MPPDTNVNPGMFAYPIMADYEIGGISVSDGVKNAEVKNNVVSGTFFAGFHFIPDQCDERSHERIVDPTYIFEGNVAHSISGYGAVAKKVTNDCTIVHGFKAYKVT